MVQKNTPVSRKSNPKKQKVSKAKTKRHFSSLKFIFNITKTILLLGILIGCAVAGVLGGTVVGWLKTTPEIKPEQLYNNKYTSFVYDSENSVIAELERDENRVWVDLADMPKYLSESLIAIEDSRFYQHHGIDFKRTFDAIWRYPVSKFIPSIKSHGGSTITQQVVQNVTGNKQETPKRKVQEWWQAINELEKNLEKEDILEIYLNKVYFGRNYYGVQAAAQGYFGKDVSELSIAECASIIGITNYPGIYTPNDEEGIANNLRRQKIILKAMLDQEMIDEKAYNEASKEELQFFKYSESPTTIKSEQSYFVDNTVISVKKDLMEKLNITEEVALDMIYSQGLKIYTSLESNVQDALDEVFTDEKYFPVVNKNTTQLPQAAMVVIDPQTGYVRGIYGGAGEKKGSTFDRATQSKRQPGSSIKPLLVYGPAIENRLVTAATVLDDVPQYLNPKTPNNIWPKNYSYTNYGLTTIREGLYNSRNVIATLLLKDYVGFDMAYDYLKKVGLDRTDEKDTSGLAIAMGAFYKGMSPLEMASAYTVFANKGIYSSPKFYTRVEDSNGEVILENNPESKIVYSEEATYIMNNMLQDVVKKGTAYGFGTIKNKDGKIIPTAGKTGTTSDWYDKWFLGFSPYYIGATWYGYDQNTTLVSTEYNQALTIWNAVMSKIHENLEPIDFSEPSTGIVKKVICIDSGLLATDLCSKDPRGNRTREEIFIKGTEPKYGEECNVHYSATVTKDSKDIFGRPLLEGPYCPPDTVEERVFIKRPVEYKPVNPNDPYPSDWIYELTEGEYCNIHGQSESLNTETLFEFDP